MASDHWDDWGLLRMTRDDWGLLRMARDDWDD